MSHKIVERCVDGALAGMSVESISKMVGLSPALVNSILDAVANHILENAEEAEPAYKRHTIGKASEGF